jgi:phosphoribosylformylglycinamidine cyclo-ligase
MAVVVAPDDAADVTAALEAAGETVHRIGHLAKGAKGCTVAGGSDTWSAMAAWSATYQG